MTRFFSEAQYLVELEASDGNLYGFASGRGFAPTDPDADLVEAFYYPRVSGDSSLVVSRETDGAGSSSGAGGQRFGSIVLDNADGGLDALGNLGFDGRVLRIRYAPAGARAMTETEVVYRGTVTELQVQRLTVKIDARDRLEELNVPAGALVDADEWPDADGERMPVCAGEALSVPFFWLDRVKLIAAVHDAAASIDGVYDLGVAITAGTDYPDLATMKSTAPSAGQYRVFSDSSGTYIRLGSRPADFDKMAADVDTGSVDGPAQIQALAQRAGTISPRTNLLVWSEDLSQSEWLSGAGGGGTAPSITDTGTLAGKSSSIFLIPADGSSQYVYQAFTVEPGKTYTASFDTRLISANEQSLVIYDQTNGAWIVSPASADADVTDQLTAGAGRVRSTFTAPAGCTTARVYVIRRDVSAGLDMAGEVEIAGVMVTQGEDLVDYIKSESTPGTGYPDIDEAGLTALGRAWTVGGYWPGETTILQAVSEVAASLGAVIFFTRTGKLSGALLTPAAGSGVLGVYGPQSRSPGSSARQALALDRLRLGRPVKEISVGYDRAHAFWSDLGALWDTDATRAALISREYARSVVTDSATATKHLLASEDRVDTILRDETQAETMAEEVRAARGSWFYTVAIEADSAAITALELGARVDIHESRWSESAISAVIREISHDLSAGRITFGARA